MTAHAVRRGAGEFWMLAGISLLLIGGLVLFLWAPWDRPSVSSTKPLVFYCAAGMAKPVQDIVDDYQQQYGVQVQVNYAGSGQLLSNIRAGGKGDLFLSADEYHINKARREGLLAETVPVAYLQPVMIVKESTQDSLTKKGKPVTGVQDLLRTDLKVVLANPELAAVGKMIKDAFRKPEINLWAKLFPDSKQTSSRVSTVGTVNEVATAVRTSENTLGIVWRATARQMDDVAIIEPPEFADLKEVIQIGVLTSAEGEQATAALQFARYLSARDKGLDRFVAHQFDVIPDADLWAERPHIQLSAGAMLRPGVEDVVRAFAEREGVTIDTTYAGCGLLVSQMRGIKKGEKPGRFPDAYFACDVEFLDKVQDWFDAGVMISHNDMVLIVPKGNPKDITALADLGKDGLKIGVGDPEKAAVGKLTDDLLKKAGLYHAVYTPDWREAGRVVYAEAGHDLVNKVRVGALDVAVVYRSNAQSNPENLQKHLDIVEIEIADALAKQPFAIAKDSPHRYLMKRLLRAIVAQQSADRFKSLGFRWVYDGK
jgi:molybdenum ABC transporter molybdate-binding protein